MLDDAPKVDVFLVSEFHECPLGCWLDMMNCGVMADQVKWEYSSTSRTVVSAGRGVDDVG